MTEEDILNYIGGEVAHQTEKNVAEYTENLWKSTSNKAWRECLLYLRELVRENLNSVEEIYIPPSSRNQKYSPPILLGKVTYPPPDFHVNDEYSLTWNLKCLHKNMCLLC